MSLAVKYRPKKLSDVVCQDVTVKVLEKQIEKKQYSNTYIFSGPSGCGKTTIARILANQISSDEPIEIDAASNNGVDNIRNIIEHAYERSFSSDYKIYIIDECHMLTQQSWNALLKLIEEPPMYTIFMFCTTNLSKVPQTIVNRCQLYKLTKIPSKEIVSRLENICKKENILYDFEGLEYISKVSQGSLRQAISNLDFCKDYGKITANNVQKSLGSYSYDIHFELINYLLNGDIDKTIVLIDKLYNEGTDLKLYLDQFISFILDVLKYASYKTLDMTDIPQSYERDVKNITNLATDVKELYKKLLFKLLRIKVNLNNDATPKETLEIGLINIYE